MSDSDNQNSSPSGSKGATRNLRRKAYVQRFRKEWQLYSEMKDWLVPKIITGVPVAACKYCNKILTNHLRDLRKHACSRKHERMTEQSLVQLKEELEPDIADVIIKVSGNEETNEYEEAMYPEITEERNYKEGDAVPELDYNSTCSPQDEFTEFDQPILKSVFDQQ